MLTPAQGRAILDMIGPAPRFGGDPYATVRRVVKEAISPDPDPTQDFLLDRMREVLCEIQDDRARITSVTTMTAGRIGFTAQGEHYTLEIRKGQV